MKTTTELQLRKIALVLTAVLLLQVLWSGARFLLMSEPAPILPAEASLQVDDIRYAAQLDEELSQAIASRPMFWRGRQAYSPPVDAVEVGEAEPPPRNSDIDEVALQGFYTAGAKSGVIVSYRDERRRLQAEESIAGWTYTGLGDGGAVFENGDNSQVLQLEHAYPGPAPKVKIEKSSGQSDTNKRDKTGE